MNVLLERQLILLPTVGLKCWLGKLFRYVVMHHGSVSRQMPARSADVFDLLHDYNRRLEWDTLLSAAHLTDGHSQAALGVTSICVGRASIGKLALQTVYVSFDRPRLAAVKMINSPPFFRTWAASICHHDNGSHSSLLTYTWTFTARPQWLAWLLEPVIGFVFYWETRKRLKALHDFLPKRNQQ